MRAYATLADFGRLGLPTKALAGLDETTRKAQLESASRLANGHLRHRYQLPLLWEILSSASRSSGGTGSVVDTHSAGSLELLLDVTLLSTGGSLDVSLEHSDDGLAGWEQVGSFPQLTKAGQARESFEEVKRYVRVVWTLTGSATFGAEVAADDLRRAVCCIAAYDLLSVRGYNPEGADENLRLRYEDAIRWLKGVASGFIDPGLIDSTPDEEEGGVATAGCARRGW